MVTDPRTGRNAPGRRRLLWIALGLAALVAVAWGALALLFPPARVRALVESQLSRTLAREVSFEDASIWLWPPVRLRVRGPRLAEPGGFAHGAAFEAQALDLDLDVPALLARRLVVRRLVLERPALHLVMGPEGGTNFEGVVRGEAGPAGPKAGGPAPPFDLAVRELAVAGGRVLVDDLAARRRTAFGIDSRLGLSLERGGSRVATQGSTQVHGLCFGPLAARRPADLNASLAKVEWRIDHRGKYDAASKRLALERLVLAAGRAEAGLSGVVDDLPGQARVSLRARGASLDLGPLLDALAAADARALHGIRGSGRLDFDLAVRGVLAPGRMLEVTGSLAVANGAFRYPGAPAAVEGLGFTARLAPDSLGIGDLAARVAGQPVRGALEVTRYADPEVRFTLRGDVDLAAVSPLVAPKDAKLAGSVALDVGGYGRAKDPNAMVLDGRARLAGVSVESPALPRKIEQVSGEVAFSPARAEVRGLGLRAGGSSLTLDGTVTRPLALVASPARTGPADVDFTLRSPHLDLAELLPVTPGGPLLPNARGGGRIEIARLKDARLDVANVAARVALSPQVLEVPEFALDGYGGAVHGAARFDFRDPGRPIYALKARVDTVEADRLLSAWTPARGLLHGALNTTLDLSGEGSSPEDLKRTLTAVGLAAVANGALGPGPALEALSQFTRIPELEQVRFRDLRLPFRVERGRMITDPVVLTGSNGEWRLSGGIGFDGSLDYAVSTTLPPDVVKKLGADAALAAGALADEQGRILIDLRVSGSARSPRVNWDRKAMAERAAGRLSSALEEQRAKLEAGLRDALVPLQAAGDSAPGTKVLSGRALEDSLRKAARDLLKGLFGGVKRDSGPH